MDSVDDIKYFGLTRILASDGIEDVILNDVVEDIEILNLASQDTILPPDNFEVQESKLPESIKTQEDIIRDVAKSW